MAEQLRMEATVVDKATGPLKQIKASLEGIQSTPHMQRLQEDFKHLREHTDHLASGAASLTEGFGGIGVASLAASISIASLVKGYKDLASRAVELRALSHETGLSADAINQLERAAQDFGVSGDTVSKGLSTWADKMFDFRRGVGELRAEMNAQFPDIAKRLDLETPTEQLREFEKLLAGMANDPIRQKRWSELIFGNGDMSRMFADGLKPLDDALKSAQERLGKITPDLQKQALEFSRSINAFNDSLDKLETSTGPFVFKELKLAADDFRSAFEAIQKAAEWFEKVRNDPAGAAKDLLDGADKAFNDKANEVGDRWRGRTGAGAQRGEDGNALRRNDEMPAENPYDHPMKGHPNVRIIEGSPDPYADLRQKSSYTSGSIGTMSPGLQGVIQAGVRAGVVQGLMDFSTMKDAESRVGGGGFQSASYETWNGEGGGGGGTGRSGARGRSGGSFGKTPDGPAGSVPGNLRARGMDAMRYLVEKKGWTPEGAAISIGNAQQESGIRGDGPAGDGGMSQHMYQWNRDRLARLKDFAAKRGKSASDFETNLDFMDEERKGRSALERQWHKQTDLSNAGALGHLYEGYGDNSTGTRVQNARNWLNAWRNRSKALADQNPRGPDMQGNGLLRQYDQPRPSLWDAQKRAGMGPQAPKAEGGFHGTIEFKGGPDISRTSIRLYDMMDSVKIKRGPTMTTPNYEA